MKVLCVLPARISSQRIPRKPLQEIAGRTLIEWSWRAAVRVPGVDEVCVATDAEEIAACVRDFGGRAVLTDPAHVSGTDRVAEAARRDGARSPDVVVNYQSDEPFLDPEAVGGVVREVRRGRAAVVTLAAPIRSATEWRSEAIVKVARARTGEALYFSRAPIPHPRGRPPEFGEADAPGGEARTPFLRHLGLYAFTREALDRWTALEPSPLERLERLEQLRALEAGIRMRVVVGPPCEPGIDVPDDLARAGRLLRQREINRRDEANV